MSKEVLQEALELLAVATFITPKLQAKRTDVINAGLQSLAEQPQQEPDDKRVIELATRYGLDHSMLGALRNFADAYSGKRLSYQKIDLSEDQLQRLTTKASFIPGLVMDTSPPAQRTWVGLSDEEIAQGNKESWVTEQAWQSAVWWAEAKLKEKNQ